MDIDPSDYHRRSIRLPDYDYTRPGAYFITIVIHRREPLLGRIVADEMILNQHGELVRHAWLDLPNRYVNVRVNHFCVMPNHIHGILELMDVEPVVNHYPVHEIVRGFKSVSTNRVNNLRLAPGQPVWQRNYYEHIIRNEREFQAIIDYMATNPIHWDQDTENKTV
jgi:putative transposase